MVYRRQIVNHNVVSMAISFLNGGFLLKQLNHTLISLILKVDQPETFKDFRPIGLCNIVYNKILSKVIVNRLQPIMEEVISPNQSAFVNIVHIVILENYFFN